jgi:hypothetical protein
MEPQIAVARLTLGSEQLLHVAPSAFHQLRLAVSAGGSQLNAGHIRRYCTIIYYVHSIQINISHKKYLT